MEIHSVSNSAAAFKAYRKTEEYLKDEKESGKVTENLTDKQHSSDSLEISDKAKEAVKGMDVQKLKALQDEQIAFFKNMLAGMLNRQAGMSKKANGNSLELSKDLFQTLTVTPEEAAQASQAISEDGEWGVKAVAGRIMDMAIALSGGDVSKLEILKNAVDKGFSEAEKQWGGKLPSICQDTRNEINNRFDYWKENGSLDGYTM